MSSHRLEELDCLRGLAALSVVLFHYTKRYQDLYGFDISPLMNFSLGHYGVQLFFVISGFVIFMTLKRCKIPMDFVVSRFARLFPVYWVALTLTFCCLVIIGIEGKNPTIFEYVVNLSMLQGFFGVKDVDGVYWTLMWELQFYVFAYIVFKYGAEKHIHSILAAWLGIQTIIGVLLLFDVWVPWKVQHLLLAPYSNLFSAGIIFYLIREEGPSAFKYLLLALALGNELLMHSIESFLICSGIFLILLSFVNQRLGFIINRPMLYLGGISYSLYLIHEAIGWISIRYLQGQGLEVNLSILLTIMLVLSLASILTYSVERPAMRKIRSTYAKRGQQQVPGNT